MFSASDQAATVDNRARRKRGRRQPLPSSRRENIPPWIGDETQGEDEPDAGFQMAAETDGAQAIENALCPPSRPYPTPITSTTEQFSSSPPFSSRPDWEPQPHPESFKEHKYDAESLELSPQQLPSDMSIPMDYRTKSTERSPKASNNHRSPRLEQARLYPDSNAQESPFSRRLSGVSTRSHPATSRGGDVRPRNPGLQPYFRSFDTLQAAGVAPFSAPNNVILTGYDEYLEVTSIDQQRVKVIARLHVEGAAAVGGKIISCTSRQDPFHELRPLLAIVLYGFPNDFEPEKNSIRAGNTSRVEGKSSGVTANRFETRVEVRSLKDGAHITTLYKSPLKDLPFQSIDESLASNLRIDSQGGFIVVASGLSGEIFVFAPSSSYSSSQEKFRCIGKFWTSIRKRSQQKDDEYNTAVRSEVSESREYTPIYSLSERWLAIAPPSSASRHSVEGLVPISPDESRPPGVESVTAPAPPASNCNVDIPDPESLTNKMAQGIAKEVVKGAQWVSAYGWETWQNYWNKPLQSGSNVGSRNDITSPSQFPPTHAVHQRNTSEEVDPGDQISIVDLKLLLNSDSPRMRNRHEQIATFTTPSGCSFLSFSPSGLLLLTVSQNGDTQRVWDLVSLRARKTGKASGQTDRSVRQVARFSRFTNASVVHVAWSAPKCDKIAVATQKGTVHIFNIPTQAFIWTPSRRSSSLETPMEAQKLRRESSLPKYEDTRLPMGQPGALSVAASKVSDSTRPIVQKVRQGSSSGISMISNNLGDFQFSTAAGLQKGKALAVGVSKSFGAAAGHINQMRRASESRFHIKRGNAGVQAGCVRFLTGDERGYVGAISEDSIVLHWLHRSAQLTAGASTSNKDQELSFSTNQSTSQPIKPSMFFLSPSTTLVSAITGSSTSELAPSAHPLAHAEIDTVAPFAPFHADRRIILSTYREPELWDHEVKIFDSEGPWGFGARIPTKTMSVSETTEPTRPLAKDNNSLSSNIPEKYEKRPATIASDANPTTGIETAPGNVDLLDLETALSDASEERNLEPQRHSIDALSNPDIDIDVDANIAWESMNSNDKDDDGFRFSEDSDPRFNW